MKFVIAGVVLLAAIFLVPPILDIIGELTGTMNDTLNLSSEKQMVVDAFPMLLIGLPVVIIFVILFRRSGGGLDE